MHRRRFITCCLAVLLPLLPGLSASSARAQTIMAKAPASSVAAFLGTAAPKPVMAAPAPEMSESGDVVRDIRVEGAQRIEADTVTSYLVLAKGDAATPSKIDASLKALYATGLFADVDVRMEDGTLVVKVDENPIINRVAFEGNDAISKDDLEKEVQIKARLVYTLPRVQRDVQRILELYRRSGRFAAIVEPKIIKLEQNRIDLVFEITEGKRTGIRSIKFVGNTHYGEDELNQVISTRESAWWRVFSSTDYYDPDRLNYDKELLRKFYLREGYVDFRVLSGVAELTPDRDDFFVTFTVEEGSRYKFGKIDIKNEIKGLDGESLRPLLATHKGDWYNADQIEKTIAVLTTALGDKQYAFVNITPEPNRHKDTLSVDLTYHIKQGERVYIGRIDISGNTRTVDKVIRRQILVAEGDPFSTTAIHKSEQNLKDLGFFETAKVTPTDGAQPDRADVKVDVKEKSTGEVAIGAGFSSTDGPLGDFTLSEHNFLGEGQDARFGATLSGRTQQIDTSFTEPYFLNRDLSAGADLFYIQTDNQDLSSYNTTSAGVNLRMGYPLSQQLRQRLSYSFHDDTISSVPAGASLYIVDQQGTSTTSSFGQALTYDTRDSKLDPTAGFLTHLDTDVAGAGGSRQWVRLKLGGTQYYSFAEKWIFSGTLEAGQIWGLNGPTKINERFFLGGDTLRGFQYAGIGPRDITSVNQDALGGDRFARGSAEMTMPTPLPPELGLKSHLFVDAGVLGQAKALQIPGDVFANDDSVHLSIGVGVTWQSPFGPVRLDFAEPILYKTYDKIEHIHFSFGTKF
ncbi:MAG: outer membrane protein assembly factor BamA [Pseudomonadota bacterium]|nr:outer membrane protein assembly factor BamA [Pseudomonadota bacterium]